MQTDEALINDQDIEDLTLALIYLTAWRPEFKLPDGTTQTGDLTAWKGYDFGTLDVLIEKGLTDSNRRSKSLMLTDKGEARAQELIQRLLGKAFVNDTTMKA